MVEILKHTNFEKLNSRAVVNRFTGKSGDVVDIIFELDDGGFHIVVHRMGGHAHFIGTGQNVKIYKTYAAAQQEAGRWI